MSNRNGFSPALRAQSRNSGSCVSGVQLATIRRLAPRLRTFAEMSAMLSREQAYSFSSAWITPGNAFAYSATSPQSR